MYTHQSALSPISQRERVRPQSALASCLSVCLSLLLAAVNVSAQSRTMELKQREIEHARAERLRASDRRLRQLTQGRTEYLKSHLDPSLYRETRGETIIVDGVVDEPVSAATATDEPTSVTTAKNAFGGGIIQPRWNQLAGPEAATVFALLEHKGRILAGTLGGIYYSDDQGLTWQLSGGSPLKFTGFRFVALGDAIFTGLDGFIANDGPSGGVLRSLDNGMTWERLYTGLADLPMVVYLEKWQDKALLASLAGGLVYRSTDNGASWQPAMNGLPEKLGYFNTISSDKAIIAATGKGLFRSLDGGLQWEDISANLPAGTELIPRLFPLVLGDSFVVFAGAGGALISDDNGASWRAINNGFPANALVGDVALFGNTLYATLADGVAYVSTDRGVNWSKQNDSFAFGQALTATLAVGDVYFFGTREGVYRSEDSGKTWQRSMAGMRASFVNGGILSVGRRLFAAAEGGVWASDNKGATWRLLDNGLRRYPFSDITAAGLAVKDGILYAGVFGDGLYRSDNGGNSFERVENGLPARWATVVIKVLNGKIYAGDYFGGAYVSADDGATWEPLKGLPEGYALFSMGNLGGGRLLAGGYPGKVHRSDDNGATWREFHTGINLEFISDFINVGSSCLVATDDGVYRLNDDESGWAAVTTFKAISDHSNGFGRLGKTIYSCSFGYGITISHDNGATWGNFNNGMSTMRGFFFAEHQGDLYFGSGGAGIWVLRAPATKPPIIVPPPDDPSDDLSNDN